MSIPVRHSLREPLHPTTLIALKVLGDFIKWIEESFDLEDSEGIIKSQRAFREQLEEPYFIDLLWGRLSFNLTETNPPIATFPPIFDLLQIFNAAKIPELRCEIYVTNQEKHEYKKTVSMQYLHMIKQILPGGVDEITQEKSSSIWGQLNPGPIFSTLGESDHLCTSLVTARQEIIGRDHHKDLQDNPHKDPVVITTKDFIHFNPIHLLFLSAPQKTRTAAREALDDYLNAYERGEVDFVMDRLPWEKQVQHMRDILYKKYEALQQSTFWVSQKDFVAMDPFVLDSLKPVETMLLLAKRGELSIAEAGQIDASKHLQIRVNVHQPQRLQSLRPLKSGPMSTLAVGYLSVSRKRQLIAEIILDQLQLSPDKNVISVDPKVFVDSIQGLSKKELHDICTALQTDGYIQVKFHYPPSPLVPLHKAPIGKLADGIDRLHRLTITVDGGKLLTLIERRAEQEPAEKVETVEEDDLGPIAYVLTRNISGHLLINERLLIKPTSGSVGDRFAEYILRSDHPCPLIIPKEELTRIRSTDKKEIPKIITDLGFKGDLRTIFFPAVSKNQVTFVNPIYEKDLSERGLKRLEDYD